MDSLQPRLLGFFLRPCDLLKKVASVRIILLTDGALGFSDKLGNNMEVMHRTEKFGDITEFSVYVYLL